MKSLGNIAGMEMIRIPGFTMDRFQEEVYNNLYLEFFLERCRVLITPRLDYLTTGETNPSEIEDLEAILQSGQEALTKLRHYLVYNLSLYSALLETNSYYIAQNGYLVIARFVPVEDHPELFEVKLYTITAEELPNNYRDKIYLGRDFISLRSLRREHLGLKQIKNSIVSQVLKLKGRLTKSTPADFMKELEEEYLREIEEIAGEFAEEAQQIIDTFPPEISSHTLEQETLIEVNTQFRELKHILIEIEETLQEMEIRMFDYNHLKSVRYVTKFKKDITNDINYILFKINGRISDSINTIHL